MTTVVRKKSQNKAAPVHAAAEFVGYVAFNTRISLSNIRYSGPVLASDVELGSSSFASC
jgi:hypothetical protein